MRIDAIKNKVSKIRDLLEDLKSKVEADIYDLAAKGKLTEKQKERYDFLNELQSILENADYQLSDYE